MLVVLLIVVGWYANDWHRYTLAPVEKRIEQKSGNRNILEGVGDKEKKICRQSQ